MTTINYHGTRASSALSPPSTGLNLVVIALLAYSSAVELRLRLFSGRIHHVRRSHALFRLICGRGSLADIISPAYDWIVTKAKRKTPMAIYLEDSDPAFTQTRRTRDLLESHGLPVHHEEIPTRTITMAQPPPRSIRMFGAS